MVRIRIMPSKVSKRVDFEINGLGRFHTNREGEGLWIGGSDDRQVIGTCQFNLLQKTRSGKRKAIERLFKEIGWL